MDISYQGFFVGPVSDATRLRSALAATGVPAVRIFDDGPRGAWCVVHIRRLAESLAQELGEGTWVWEVELQNDFEAETNGNESHSGTFRGWQPGSQAPAVKAELWEEGYIRGGVMEDCALEYVGWHLDEALEAQSAAGAGPPNSDDPAAWLIDALLAGGLLEIVNDRAHRTLHEPIEQCLAERDPHEAAARVLSVLEDAVEVAEVYADEREVEALIAQLGPA